MTESPRVAVMAEFISEKDNSTGYYLQTLIKWLVDEFGSALVFAPISSNVAIDNKTKFVLFSSLRLNKNNIFGRIISQVSQVIGFVTNALIKLRPGMVVITGTNPILLLLIMPLLKAFTRTKWILLAYDIYPENIVLSGLIKKNSIIYRVANIWFSYAYRSADKVVAIGRDMAEVIHGKGVCLDKITYQPNWVNSGDVKPLLKSESPLIKKLGWESNVVFQYFGNMGRVQGIEQLLETILSVKSENARFLFCGGGFYADKVMDFCSKNDKCHYIPDNAYEKDLILSSCDIALVSLTSGMYGLGVPSKSYFSLAANRPILVVGDTGSELDLVLREDNAGWFIDSSNKDAVADLISEICDSHQHSIICPETLYKNHYNGHRARQVIIGLVKDTI